MNLALDMTAREIIQAAKDCPGECAGCAYCDDKDQCDLINMHGEMAKALMSCSIAGLAHVLKKAVEKLAEEDD